MYVYGYLKKNQKPFRTVPFNAVDALAIAWMAYFDFASVKEKLPLTLKGIEFNKTDAYYLTIDLEERNYWIMTMF